MAERRMFAKKIIDSDAFLDMPLSTQALYFHLSMRADDEGFINNPKRIQRLIGSSDDDMKLLIAKAYIIPFDSGIVVIRHWKINNYLRNDRFTATECEAEKAQLTESQRGVYELGIPNDNRAVDNGYPQVSIGKYSIGEVSIGKDREDIQRACAREESEKVSPSIQSVFDFWNEQNIIVHRELTAPLITAIKKAIAEYSESSVKEFIKHYKTVLDDRSYFFSYKWSLLDFLTRKSGIAAFTDEGSKWADYMAKREHKCLLDGTRINEEDYPW